MSSIRFLIMYNQGAQSLLSNTLALQFLSFFYQKLTGNKMAFPAFRLLSLPRLVVNELKNAISENI